MTKHALCILLLTFVLMALANCGGGGGPAANEDPAVARAALIQDHNALRTARGLTVFTEVASLNAVALAQAQYEASIGNWSATDAEGHTVTQRIQAAGLTCTAAADNNDMAGSEAELWSWWSTDTAALTPITQAAFDQIGAGMVIKNGVEYWSVIYATGVAAAS